MVEGPLSFYSSRGSGEELEPPFQLEAVEAGETVERSVFIENDIGYRIDIISLEIEGSDEVRISDRPESVEPSRRGEVELVFEADTVRLEPVEFSLKGDYRFKTV